jgi:hypothetical protein
VTVATQMKDGLYHDQFPTNMFFPLVEKVLEIYTSKHTSFFIDVLTWRGEQKALETFLFQCTHIL